MAHAYIALDDGHGMSTAGKRTPYIASLKRTIKENEFNRAVVYYLDKELRHNGFKTLLVAPGDKDHSLKSRTDLANKKKVDAYIACHYNAYDSSFKGANPSGVETYVHPDAPGSTVKLAKCIHGEVIRGTKQKDRGVKKADFHVLRETKMHAVLVECGFMDNEREALLMLDKGFQKETAIDICKGICEFYGVKYKSEEKPKPKPKPEPKPEKKDGKLYAVQAGAFEEKNNAEERLEKLKDAGVEAFIYTKKK
ncbi:N-acetylmuramoyl-L-alanine amidase [Mechercharimyces sp. CAU 1602]|uniref:N-acetylmuramoyl-L-alanine amidase n=1 Tax=Mechercharimyces sp. CAU 1602 TaxID=2973933 RepID=UPI00216215BA|nr:N-acetylmuramoyl-L-alanine amidase [Mechercharimyces sp. CAU 1602]MCS1351138.1 N-acetylmuramoyl-L-alanine amidase [Mechercharimyces sp. CAU 1602]